MIGYKKAVIMLMALSLTLLLFACNTSEKNKQSVQPSQPVQGGIIDQAHLGKQGKMPEEALFVCLYTTNQVAVIDLGTNEIVKIIPVGAKPIALIKSPDNRYVYVSNSGSGDVYMINTTTGEIDAKIPMGNQPVAMTTNAKGDKLYVVDYFLNRVSVIDVTLRSMVSTYELNTFGFEDRIEPPDCCSDMFGDPVGAGRKPSAIALDEAAGKIYVGNLGTWDVAVIDIEEEKEVNAFDGDSGINRILQAGVRGYLYISAAGTDLEVKDSIIVVNLKGGEIVDRIEVGEKPVSMALSPDGDTIYVVTQKESYLTRLTVSEKEISKHFIEGGQLGDFVLSNDGSKAYICDLVGGTVIIVDTSTCEVISTIEVGITPKSLVYIK